MSVQDVEWQPRGVEELEPAAWEALRAGMISVSAGPGSGKSEFLAQLAGYLFETDRCPYPQQILAISFKRSSARNLQERVTTRIPEYAPRLASMTFDAFTKMLLDRFKRLLPEPWRMTDEYTMDFPSWRDIEDFLRDVKDSAPPEFQDAVQAIKSDTFVSELVGTTPLDAKLGTPTTGEEFAVREWWNDRYLNRSTPDMDFTMINRLVDLIIRTSPQLRRALALTYPYVFVDEFQDTTYAQYALLRRIFKKTNSALTVVGDPNQRIMGWAGAHKNAFKQFNKDFGTRSIALSDNHRSSEHLVDLQHRIAKLVAPQARKQVSKVIRERGESVAQIWTFSTPAREATVIARWIADDIASSSRVPADYALIARQKVADMESTFAAAFKDVGLRVRNDDADYEGVRLQDLLQYELTHLLLDLLRMGATAGGNPRAWRNATETLARLIPDSDEMDNARATVDSSLSAFLESLRSWCGSNPISKKDSEKVTVVGGLTDRLIDFVDLDRIASSRFLAESMDDAKFILKGFMARLRDTIERTTGWAEVADAFVESDAVPLLTIHRSKGMEYHTVFFLALDDKQWWAHRRNAVESTMSFYVGVTRAMERIVFTYVSRRGRRSGIEVFYSELEAAGVPILEMDGTE